MSEKLKWKDALLSSNMPLEFEAANLLISKGFTVHSEFKYAQYDEKGLKDAAVDLYAGAYPPFSNPQKVTARIELLIECAHRYPDEAWIFLPDLNKSGDSRIILGNTIRVVDKFSPYVIRSEAAFHFDADIPVCQRGFELDLKTGHSYDAVFKKGLAQLQYALPRLMIENILFYLGIPPEHNVPFIFCPILLTTAPLFVMNKAITIPQIEAASKIADIATSVPYLIIYSDYSPNFESLCKRESDRLKILQRSDKTKSIEQKRARYYKDQQSLPFTIIESLTEGNRYYLNEFFTQFIICTKPAFESLIQAIRQTVVSALRTRKLLE